MVHYLPLIFPLFILIPFVLIFLLLFLGGIFGSIKAGASRSWPSTPGQITESSIQEKQKKDRIKYKPRVKYTYNVQGQAYSSDTINFGGREAIQSRQDADIYISRFEKGKQLQVFYNPNNPKEACLLPGEGAGGITTIVGLVGLLITGGIGFAIYASFIG